MKRVCCRAGHPLTGDNLFISSGRRRCRACHNAGQQSRRKKERPKGRPSRADLPFSQRYDPLSQKEVEVRCSWCLGRFREMPKEMGACPHCGRSTRGAA